MNNTELNEAVARKLGWTKATDEHCHKYAGNHFPKGHWCKNDDATYSPQPYSTDIAAAWEIVEHVNQNGLGHWLIFQTQCSGFRTWAAGITDRPGVESVDAEATTAPHAICLAFLKLP